MERTNKGLQLANPERPASVAAALPLGAADGPGADGAAAGATVEYTHTRVVKVAPSVLEAARLVTGRGLDPVTQAYKLLRTQVLQRLAERGWQTIAVVSPSPGEGKTLTAINLSLALATSLQHTTLLVDFDWRRPSVHRHFELQPEHDVTDYLAGKQPLSGVLINPGVPRFCLLPCKGPVGDSSERLASAPVQQLVRELKNRYRNRVVLFDLPPVLVADDALSFLPQVDCALVVVQDDRTKRGELLRTLELIGPSRLLGTVMNRARQRLPRY